MYKKFIILLLLSIIVSCNCEQTQLTDNEKKWVVAYNQGDVIIFKSNRGNFDTLTVVSKEESYTNPDCNPMIGKTQENFVSIELKPFKCHDKNYCEGIIAIYKKAYETDSFPFFRFFGLEYAPEIQDKKLTTRKIKLLSNSKRYDAYYFENNINAQGSDSGYLDSFYYDKKDGLIRYDAKDGEVFELFKRTSKTKTQN